MSSPKLKPKSILFVQVASAVLFVVACALVAYWAHAHGNASVFSWGGVVVGAVAGLLVRHAIELRAWVNIRRAMANAAHVDESTAILRGLLVKICNLACAPDLCGSGEHRCAERLAVVQSPVVLPPLDAGSRNIQIGPSMNVEHVIACADQLAGSGPRRILFDPDRDARLIAILKNALASSIPTTGQDRLEFAAQCGLLRGTIEAVLVQLEVV